MFHCDNISIVTDSNTNTDFQPGLFDPQTSFEASDVLKHALGDFQDRGFELEGRELALDRLLGALKRAFEAFDITPWTDEAVAETLKHLGADVKEVPAFVAKHPFRITVSEELARESLEYYRRLKNKEI